MNTWVVGQSELKLYQRSLLCTIFQIHKIELKSFQSKSALNYNILNQMKIWSSHLLDNLSNCLMNLKNSGDSTGFEPMTSVMPVQCSNQLSYEVTQLRAGQFVGLVFSRERNVVWKMCYMKCGVWNQMKIWSSHLLDSNPVESPEFFRFMRQLLKLSSKCEDHIFIWFQTPHFI